MSDSWTTYLASLPPELRSYDASRDDVILIAGGRRVTVAELHAVLREQITPAPHASQRPLRQDREGAGLLASAWRQIVFGQSRAVLALLKAGCTLEAKANARVALEHAVYLRRLALAVDAGRLEAFLRGVQRRSHEVSGHELTYLESLTDSSDVVTPALRDVLQQLRSAHDAETSRNAEPAAQAPGMNLRSASKVFKGTPGGEHLYAAFREFSQNVHAGLASAVPYLLPAVQVEPRKLSSPAPTPWAPGLALLCWSCWAADDALLRFLDDDADPTVRHRDLLARVGLAGA